MQTESFGARLRGQRERQQVALAAIAEQTKIKLSLLDGLERDDVSQWPSGIFRRSYLRAYARAIGLDPDAVVREFFEHYPEPVDDIPGALATAAEVAAASNGRRPPMRLRYLIGSAISALPSLRPQARREAEPAAAPAPAPLAAAAPPPAAPARIDPVMVELAAALDEAAGAPEPAALRSEPTIDADGPLPLTADVDPAPADPMRLERELVEMARLCTRLGRASEPRDVAPTLGEAARVLDAAGLILWLWDPCAQALRSVLAHGYGNDLLAQLPAVRRDADNAIAAAYRSADVRIVDAGPAATGAVVVPVVTWAGCAGVLALELRNGGEQRAAVHAFAMMLAAQLATVVAGVPVAEAVSA